MFYDQFAFQARIAPNASAAILGQGRLTYGQALRAVNALARHFVASGVRPGHRVLAPHRDAIVALLCQFALDKVGAATCVLATAQRPAWLDWYVTHEPDTSPKAIVVPAHLSELRAGNKAPPHVWQVHEASRIKNSSGSTGRRKTIVRSYGSTREGLEADHFMMPLRPGMVCASYLGWSGPALSTKTNCWLHGATVFVPKPDQPVFPQIAEAGATMLAVSPANLQQVVTRNEPLERLPGLTIYLFGGRASPMLVERFMNGVTPNIVMTYGSTETGSVMMAPLDAQALAETTQGYVIPPRRVEVIDPATGAVAPAGTTGKLRLHTTDMRHDGYLSKDGNVTPFDAAGDGFVPGDIGSIRADGLVTVFGREDDVINMGGRKLLTKDLDDAVQKSGLAVDQAALNVLVPGGPSHACVTVVPKPGVDLRQIRQSLRATFPGLVHLRLFRVDVVPRLPNSKVDYEKLRKGILHALEEERGKEPVA